LILPSPFGRFRRFIAQDRGYFIVAIQLPDGASLARTDASSAVPADHLATPGSTSQSHSRVLGGYASQQRGAARLRRSSRSTSVVTARHEQADRDGSSSGSQSGRHLRHPSARQGLGTGGG
jgi:multidrug efflux pump subunit AcrB